jgi:RNA polymerase III subunit RPC82 helix-turn-helix domain.
MPYFVRPVESKVLVALRKHGDSPVEALVAHSGLSPEDVRKALSALQRRGLVVESSTARYTLTDDGLKTSLNAAPGGAREPVTGIFLLDDEIEETASATSEDELNRALDDALGARDDVSDQ